MCADEFDECDAPMEVTGGNQSEIPSGNLEADVFAVNDFRLCKGRLYVGSASLGRGLGEAIPVGKRRCGMRMFATKRV